MQKNILIFKKSSKRNEIILQRYYNSITNLKFLGYNIFEGF